MDSYLKLEKIVLLLHTVKFLKFTQVYHRLYYFIRHKVRCLRGFFYPFFISSISTQLLLDVSIPSNDSFEDKKFTFLNLVYTFDGKCNWNFSDYGKLWTYNLTYFEFLNQVNISEEDGIKLIHDFIDQSEQLKDGLESFPISLRGINWIKFLTYHSVSEHKIDNSLYAQYQILMDNIEYHLLGNHLLENAFSLFFGAYYFRDEKFYTKAKKILKAELEEQILKDGAHFELSPMYHQIMLFRVLDCINLVQNNDWKNKELFTLLTNKAEIMLGWLNTITFKNGNIPLLNDSANHIAPTTKELNEYASILKVETKELNLNDSGYRKIKNKNYEIILDVGKIGPDYIPGHAHSDTFNFELYIDGKPFIVDTGLSTYETNERRILERSTASHNTVELEYIEQSEIWGAFRVASRAKVSNLVEKENYISAQHDGYKKKFSAMHQREYILENNSIKLIDTIHSKKRYNAIARLHFYPGISVEKRDNIILCDDIPIYTSSNDVEILDYSYAPEFNKNISAWMIEIKFNDRLELEIKI